MIFKIATTHSAWLSKFWKNNALREQSRGGEQQPAAASATRWRALEFCPLFSSADRNLAHCHQSVRKHLGTLISEEKKTRPSGLWPFGIWK